MTRKLITVALHIDTFINLYGYVYRNTYELGDVVDFNDPAVPTPALATSAPRRKSTPAA